MNREGFKRWLIKEKALKDSTASSRVSNVGRIDNEYDLDDAYAADNLFGLMTIFENAIREAKEGLAPNIDIEINGDYCSGLSTLKNALALYAEYMRSNPICEHEVDNKPIKEMRKVVQIPEEDNEGEEESGPFFIGDIKAFKKYIAAGYRNQVNYWAKPEREKLHGRCECCGQRSELQSAHREGMEFRDIIIRILENKYKIKDNYYKVDLANFEIEFKEAHTPIRDVFFFLCESCHNKYDKSKEITTEQLENIRITHNYI